MNELDLLNLLSGLGLDETRYFEQIGSTNTYAQEWILDGGDDHSLVVADEQTAGKGRLDRSWFTPRGAALAFSLILKPKDIPDVREVLTRYTALGALAVCDILTVNYGLDARIKWPNDVLLDGKKVSGVLAEAFWMENQLTGVALGIGVNVYKDAVPETAPLVFPATSIEGHFSGRPDRWILLREILERILFLENTIHEKNFIPQWENRLAFRGEVVTIFGPSSEVTGIIMGLDSIGKLLIELPSGEVIAIQAGEIRIRPLNT
ncbi:MAG: biotin--[acetyl-CoA-carboxylase] ligase [Anaerolineales bacterium]|nr:biotin--[acetyl-CoA-carboxylase] ligase [Anaerolineales bacterium]